MSTCLLVFMPASYLFVMDCTTGRTRGERLQVALTVAAMRCYLGLREARDAERFQEANA